MVGITNLMNPPIDEDEMLKRAITAYRKTGANQQPANTSGVCQHGRKYYVVLKNVRGPLAVYQIKDDGSLKRLESWPKDIE